MPTVDLRSSAEREADAAAWDITPAPGVTVWVCRKHTYAQLIALRLAARVGGPVRAPHHTASERACQAELALAACGALILDKTDAFRGAALRVLLHVWRDMHNRARPMLIFISDVYPASNWSSGFVPAVHHTIA